MKKIVALLLAVMMVLGVTTACNNGGTASNGDGPIELIWYAYGTSSQTGDLEMVLEEANKIITEKINVKLNLKLIDNASFQEKINMIINSGEYYDICWTANWRNPFGPAVEKGAYYEISDEMLKKHAPDLYKAYPKEYFDFGRVDGKLYAIVNLQPWVTNRPGANVQTALAEKYGFDLSTPKTVEEFEEFFLKIKENEKGIYPVIGGPNLNTRVEEVCPGGVINLDNPDFKVYRAFESPGSIANEKLSREWYDKGIYPKDIIAITPDQEMTNRNTNKYAAEMSNNATDDNAVVWSNRQKLSYSCAELAGRNPNGFLSASVGQGTMTAISINCKYPDKALELINLVNTDKEVFNMLVYGIEGVHYTKNADGSVKMKEDTRYNMSQLAWMLGNQFNAYPMEGQNLDVNEKGMRENQEAEFSPVIGFIFDQTPVVNEITQIAAVEKEYRNCLFMDDYEARIAERNAKYITAGVDKVIAECQRQLDAWRKANGK